MVKVDRPPANGFVAVVRKIYNPIGFYKGYNFVLWAISAGALLGFSLARLMYLDIDNIFCHEDQNRVGILLHLGAILPTCILAFLQLVPVIHHKLLLFHRINGYVVILVSFAGMGGVLMIAEHSFGGSFSMQIAIGLATIIFVSCKSIAFWNIKRLQIEQHRTWMIRAWVIVSNASNSTSYDLEVLNPIGWLYYHMRLIGIITAKVLVALGPEGHYEARPCSVIDFMFSGNQTLVESVHLDCAAFYSGADPDRHVLVDAFGSNGSGKVDQVASGLNLSFSAAAWLAVAIHIFAAELYLHLTPAEATRLRRVSYQWQLEAGMRLPGNAGLTTERLGDAEPFLVPESSQEKIVSEIATQRSA